MNRDGHWLLALIHDDEALQGLEGGCTASPAGEDLCQPIWSFGAVFSDCALDEFVDELDISGTYRIEQVLHPLKADRATGSQRPREAFLIELSFEIGDKAQQRLDVGLGQMLVAGGRFARRSC
jgi:hypothetical protein